MIQKTENPKADPGKLSELLAACPVNFDPNHLHEHGASPPPKVAFVPVVLVEAILSRLTRWGL
ncbi:MAG: hypothetical protein H6862_05955 [Rhodospirillales bacterium]|nr:hypothetical protein [Rhodospirillales bacterium]